MCTIDKATSLMNAAMVQEQPELFENCAFDQYHDDFGEDAPQPGDVRAFNIRCEGCGCYWQAVELTNCNGRLAFYRIDWSDPDSPTFELMSDVELEAMGLEQIA
jgi:hypothetical protein